MDTNITEQAKQFYAVLSETAPALIREDKRTDWGILTLTLINITLLFVLLDMHKEWSDTLVANILCLIFPLIALYAVVRKWSDTVQNAVLTQLRLLIETDTMVNLTAGHFIKKQPAKAMRSPQELVRRFYAFRNWVSVVFIANMLLFCLSLLGSILGD